MSKRKKKKKPRRPKFERLLTPDHFRSMLEYRRWLTRNDPMPVLVHKEPDGCGGFFSFYEEAIPQLKADLLIAGEEPGRMLQIFEEKVIPLLS